MEKRYQSYWGLQCGEVFVSFTEEIWKTEKGEKLGFVLSKCEQYKHFHIQPSRMHCRASLIAKESTCNAGDPSSIPGSGRSAWEGIGYPLHYSWASLVAQLVKNPPTMRKTWIPGSGSSPGEGKGYPLQCSGLENSMDCIVHGVTKSQTQLSDFHSLILSLTVCYIRKLRE